MEWIKCSERMPEEMDDVLSTDGILVGPCGGPEVIGIAGFQIKL